MTLPKSLREKRDALLTKGPCLIPRVGADCALVCHENDYCDCEMKEAYSQGVADHAEFVEPLIEALENAKGWVVSYGMTTYSKVAYKEAEHITELLAAYRAAMSSGDSAAETGER